MKFALTLLCLSLVANATNSDATSLISRRRRMKMSKKKLAFVKNACKKSEFKRTCEKKTLRLYRSLYRLERK